MAGTFTVSGMSSGLATGSKLIGPATITGSGVIGEILDVTLAGGDNSITIPTGATTVWIVPPSTNTATLKVRTNLNSADAGLPISPAQPFGPYDFRTPAPTTLIINAGSGVTGVELTFI